MGLNFYPILMSPLPFNDRRHTAHIVRKHGAKASIERRNTQRGRVSVMELINFLAGWKDEHKDEGTDVRKLAGSYEF